MKVVVLGVGRMGRRHLQVVQQMGWQVAGILDADPGSLAKCGQEFGVPPSRQYQDVRRCLDQSCAECAIVATTAPGHASLVLCAAEAGVPFILCEKPMASSLAACDGMIATCRRHGARLAVNHQMRFMQQYQEARRLIEGEEFGPWASITVVAGNIGLAMNGTHYFELLRWLSGEKPVEVTAWLTPTGAANPRGPHFCDVAGSVRVITSSGRRLSLDIGADHGHGVRVVYAGRNGIMVADELEGHIEYSVRGAQFRDFPTCRYGLTSQNSSIRVAPADALAPTRGVLDALINGREFPTGEDGRTAVATLVAAHVSNQNGHRPVGLDRLPLEQEFPYP